jgi:hypothetical protein
MGAVDVMFVFEIPKSMFVLCTAVILGFFLDTPPARAGEAVSKTSRAGRLSGSAPVQPLQSLEMLDNAKSLPLHPA